MPREFKKLSHSIYECKYHIVFCPKYRYRVLRDELAEYVKREIYTLCSHKDGIEVIEANVQADHVHLVLSILPKYAISNLMGYLKGKLAIRVFNCYEHLRQRYRSGHLWSLTRLLCEHDWPGRRKNPALREVARSQGQSRRSPSTASV